MEAQIKCLQKSVQDLLECKAQEQTTKEQQNAWQQTITKQLVTITNEARSEKEHNLIMQSNMSFIKRSLTHYFMEVPHKLGPQT